MDGFRSEADRVAAVLRDQIITGERRPGARLVERDLADEMGVSRVPVRDALKSLVNEGLAVAQPRTWTTVRRFSRADVDDLLEVRSALDTLAFRLAAAHRTDAHLAAMATLVAEEEAAARDGNALQARRAGADYHVVVAEAAGNDLLAELFRVTSSRVRWLLYQHDNLAEMAAEHAALLTAVAEQDAERAAQLAAAHLVTSRRAALTSLSSGQSQPADR